MKALRKSRAQIITDFIDDRLLNCYWKSGERINDNELAQELGVSRNSVRESLEHFVTIHAIEKKQWIGYFIPVIDKKFIFDTLLMRQHLEQLSLSLFEEKVTPEIIKEIEQTVDLSEKELENCEFDKFEITDYHVHEIFHKYCGNIWVEQFLSHTKYAIFLLREIDQSHGKEEYAKRSIEEHRKIIELIKNGDKLGAVDNLNKQLLTQRERLLSFFI